MQKNLLHRAKGVFQYIYRIWQSSASVWSPISTQVENLRSCRESAHAVQHAMRLATSELPSVQHFGLKLIQNWIQPKSKHQFCTQWQALKTWLLDNLKNTPWDHAEVYVRGKFADTIVSLCKFDWPSAWSDLTTSLFSLDQSLSFALISLAIWTRLAECLGEDSKDLTAARRREIAQGIARHFEEPSEAW